MHFTLLAYGSRGDVQPYVALGVGLRRAGHEVRLAAPRMYASFAAEYGLEFAPLSGDPAELMSEAVAKAGGRANLLRMPGVILSHAVPLATQMFAGVREACAGTGAIVHSLLLTSVGHEVARELGVPDFSALIFLTFAPTRAFPCQICPELPLGGAYNRLTHAAFTTLFWQGSRMSYAWIRRGHPELPPLSGWPFGDTRGRRVPILFGVSPHLIPRPADWGEDLHLTGDWRLDAPPAWRPPEELAAFLESGPPPVFVGFGSVISREAERLAAIALEALARTGQRGVLLTGWGGLAQADLPPEVFGLESAPFDWLFPRMAAAVHHGGVGTTAASLRAGLPTVVIPFTADQPFWGRQVHRLGAGPRPIPGGQLTAGKLAGAIRTALDDGTLRARAAELGARLRAEDGVGTAVGILERYLGIGERRP